MTAKNKINSNLASIKILPDGSAVVCLKNGTLFKHFYFENCEKIKEAIQKKLLNVKNWIISIEDDLCICKNVQIPANDLKQAYKMLEFEIPSLLPLEIEDVVWGCVSKKQKANLLELLLYILRIDNLEKNLVNYKNSMIAPSKAIIDSQAAMCWFDKTSQNQAHQLNVLFSHNALLILHNCNGYLQKADNFILTENSIPKNIELLKTELCESIKDIQQDSRQNIKIKISSTKKYLQKIKTHLKDVFENIEFLPLPQPVDFNSGKSIDNSDYGYHAALTEGMLKSAESPDLESFNLLPRELLKKRANKKKILNTALTAVLAVTMIFSLWSGLALKSWRLQHACQIIKKQIEPIKDISEKIEAKNLCVKGLKKQFKTRGLISALFAELYKFSPQYISISQINFSADNYTADISIKGQSSTLSNALEYPSAMKKTQILKNMQITNVQQIPKAGTSIVEFKANCRVEQNGL